MSHFYIRCVWLQPFFDDVQCHFNYLHFQQNAIQLNPLIRDMHRGAIVSYTQNAMHAFFYQHLFRCRPNGVSHTHQCLL